MRSVDVDIADPVALPAREARGVLAIEARRGAAVRVLDVLEDVDVGRRTPGLRFAGDGTRAAGPGMRQPSRCRTRSSKPSGHGSQPSSGTRDSSPDAAMLHAERASARAGISGGLPWSSPPRCCRNGTCLGSSSFVSRTRLAALRAQNTAQVAKSVFRSSALRSAAGTGAARRTRGARCRRRTCPFSMHERLVWACDLGVDAPA
jgi:hypothetical protein